MAWHLIGPTYQSLQVARRVCGLIVSSSNGPQKIELALSFTLPPDEPRYLPRTSIFGLLYQFRPSSLNSQTDLNFCVSKNCGDPKRYPSPLPTNRKTIIVVDANKIPLERVVSPS